MKLRDRAKLTKSDRAREIEKKKLKKIGDRVINTEGQRM